MCPLQYPTYFHFYQTPARIMEIVKINGLSFSSDFCCADLVHSQTAWSLTYLCCQLYFWSESSRAIQRETNLKRGIHNIPPCQLLAGHRRQSIWKCRNISRTVLNQQEVYHISGMSSLNRDRVSRVRKGRTTSDDDVTEHQWALQINFNWGPLYHTKRGMEL